MGYRRVREAWSQRFARRRNRKKLQEREPILRVAARFTEQRRRQAQVLGALAVGVVALAASLWMLGWGARLLGRFFFSRNDHYLIRTIDCQSDGLLKAAQIREYAGVREGMNLFGTDFRQLRRNLAVAPVVQSVELSRRLPDTLLIRVSERVPVARLGGEDGLYQLAVDPNGIILGPDSVLPELPVISGLRETGLRPGSRLTDPASRRALQVLELCRTEPLRSVIRIKSLDVSPADWLDLRLAQDEKVPLAFGSTDQLATKLGQLAQVLKDTARRGLVLDWMDLRIDRNQPLQYRVLGEAR